MATQNPIESEGTYPLPEAQVDRFLMKIARRLPERGEEATVVGRSLAEPRRASRERAVARGPARYARRRRGGRSSTASASATPSRSPTPPARPAEHGLPELGRASSSSAPARAARSAWSTPRACSRCCAAATTSCRRRARPRAGRAAPPARALLRRARRGRQRRRAARAACSPPCPSPQLDHSARRQRRRERQPLLAAAAPARQGPGPIPRPLLDALDLPIARRAARALPGDHRAAGVGARHRARAAAAVRGRATTCARSTRPRPRARASRTCASTSPSARSSPGCCSTCRRRWRSARRERRKADVAEGVALVVRRLGVRRGGERRRWSRFGAGAPRCCRRAASRRALRRRCGSRSAEGVATRRRAPPARARRRARPRRQGCARQPRLVVVVSDFRDQRDWRRAARRPAVATPCWRSRSATRARASCPRSGGCALVDPETGAQLEVDTSRRRRAGALRRARGRGRVPPSRASCGDCGSSTPCCPPRATGCATSAGG